MKTDIFTLIASSALVLFSCAKEKSPAPEQDAPMRFAVTVEGTTKASMTSAYLTQFYIQVTGPNNAFSYFESITKDAQGNWTASRPILWKDEESAITYAAASYGALGADYFNIPVTNDLFTSGATLGLLTDQSTQAKLNAADLLTMASTDLTFAASNKGLVPITLKHGLAKVNFVVSIENAGELTAEGIKDVVISGVYNGFSFKPLTGEVTIPSPAPKKGVVVPFLSSVEAGKATLEAVLVPETLAAGALSLYITVNGKDFQWTNSEALALAQGGEYTVPVSIDYNTVPSGPVTPDPDPTPDPAPLSGVFSVGATSTVSFSPGNLQATYNGSSWIWGFAEHQWDYIGNAAGNTSINGNGTLSANGTVDLFGWVGASSTWTGAAQYGISNSTATNNVDGYGNVGSEAQKVGWGATVGTGWRTLTRLEWLYLLSTRETGITVNSTNHARYTLAIINTDGTAVKGLIIFPDSYAGGSPAGVTWGTINAKSTFETTCTSAGWTSLEAAGCVFLPAAGYREASNVTDAGIGAGYWSSSSGYAASAFALYFESDYMTIQFGGSRKYGFSVRLVRDVAAADPAAARALAEATAEDLGKIVGADGKIYDTKAAAEAVATGNAVAMIAYVGSSTDHATYTHGLAIALADESDSNWNTAKSNCEGKSAVTNAAWLLPSKNQWNAMFNANGGNEEQYTGLNNELAAAGGDSSKLKEQGGYWSSSENGGLYVWRVRLLNGVGASWGSDYNISTYHVRACLAF